jgi:hypothetical protein
LRNRTGPIFATILSAMHASVLFIEAETFEENARMYRPVTADQQNHECCELR